MLSWRNRRYALGLLSVAAVEHPVSVYLGSINGAWQSATLQHHVF